MALAGCAPMQPTEFSQGKATKAQFMKDDYECERDARNIVGNDCKQMDMYERCMASKGYEPMPGTAKKSMCRQ